MMEVAFLFPLTSLTIVTAKLCHQMRSTLNPNISPFLRSISKLHGGSLIAQDCFHNGGGVLSSYWGRQLAL